MGKVSEPTPVSYQDEAGVGLHGGGTLLAYALVCVDVALAVGAGVSHILQVVNQTWDQAAAQVTANKEAEEAEERVH